MEPAYNRASVYGTLPLWMEREERRHFLLLYTSTGLCTVYKLFVALPIAMAGHLKVNMSVSLISMTRIFSEILTVPLDCHPQNIELISEGTATCRRHGRRPRNRFGGESNQSTETIESDP